MSKDIVVVGAGFGGLAAAALLARQGHNVTVVEKNPEPGGRASVWEQDGFRYDLGPSWYLMPDVFEGFFEALGTSTSDQLDLRRLSPSYRVYFGPSDVIDVPADIQETYALFDSFEPDGGDKLRRYLARAADQYDVAMREFVYRDYTRVTDFFNRRVMIEGARLQVFRKLDSYVSTYFSSDRARKVLEYSMVFLGGSPDNTPALYSIMSHVDLGLGVWYPMGGIGAVVDAIRRLATEAGATVLLDHEVRRIVVRDGRVAGVETARGPIDAEIVVANADYHHVETALLEPEHRQYSERYWRRRVVAPSAYVLYLGLDREVPGLEHHTLFLQHDWMEHFNTIFRRPTWPERPSYYVCAPSKTDPTMAPPGTENVFVLVPVASGLDDDDRTRERFGEMILDDLEHQIGDDIRGRTILRRTFSHRDFVGRYNAYRGTALGLAHTMRQTAVFRPRRKSSKVAGLYFNGHYTHPGIGVPMTLISSQILARDLSP